MSYLGAIDDIGASPYQIAGDPVMALVAQLNRFAGKTVTVGPKCVRSYLPNGAIPLTTIMSAQIATVAYLMAYDKANCIADERLIDFAKLAAMRAGQSDPTTWAMRNLTDLTTQIAQLGDVSGLSPAAVGITKVDPKVAPKFPTMTVALVGALAVAAFVVYKGKR